VKREAMRGGPRSIGGCGIRARRGFDCGAGMPTTNGRDAQGRKSLNPQKGKSGKTKNMYLEGGLDVL
jgi:hypothetical protein